eukprot:m.190665 g.190665  ORF g.190665 m.190665 type:complete len:87 (+) comp14825_c2_seq2:500-760(+)
MCAQPVRRVMTNHTCNARTLQFYQIKFKGCVRVLQTTTYIFDKCLVGAQWVCMCAQTSHLCCAKCGLDDDNDMHIVNRNRVLGEGK